MHDIGQNYGCMSVCKFSSYFPQIWKVVNASDSDSENHVRSSVKLEVANARTRQFSSHFSSDSNQIRYLDSICQEKEQVLSLT